MAPSPLLVSLTLAVLFFLLTPDILLRLPAYADKETVAFTHAFVFTVVVSLLHYVTFGSLPHVLVIALTFFLFYLLTPGILLRLPPHGTKQEVAATHAVVFAIAEWLLVRGLLVGTGLVKQSKI